MQHLKFIFAIGLIFVIQSCSLNQKSNAKVIFTFDDHYIDSWWKQKKLFSAYNIKASFYVTRPWKISKSEELELKQLIKDGHEIGCHGFNHIDAQEYLKKASIQEYINTEILPAKFIFDSLQIPVKTFAYPFGHHTSESDSILLSYFKGLRLATYKWESCPLDSVDRPYTRFGSSRIVDAIMIDKDAYPLNEIEKALLRAKANDEIIVFLAHGIDSVDGLHVKSSYLKEIFELCKKNQIESIKLSDLWKD